MVELLKRFNSPTASADLDALLQVLKEQNRSSSMHSQASLQQIQHL